MKAKAKLKFCVSLGLKASVAMDITWMDETGVAHISPETFARFDLATGGTANKYDRIEVAIIHQTRGCLDRKTFEFNDYFEGRTDDRQDPHRQDYYPTKNGFHAWWKPGGTFEWYIAVPAESSLALLRAAVHAYIRCFR